MTVSFLWLFHGVPQWAGLKCVIVVFPDQTHTFLTLLAEIKITPNDDVCFGLILNILKESSNAYSKQFTTKA